MFFLDQIVATASVAVLKRRGTDVRKDTGHSVSYKT